MDILIALWPLTLMCPVVMALPLVSGCAGLTLDEAGQPQIRPWCKDARYWQYRGRPALLIGASNEDNPFNHPRLPDGEPLEAHLDRLKAAGGNYVRNTMSSRDAGNLWPFARNGEGRYDLMQFDPAYWQRYEDFLKLTAARSIIVQIEVWDRFDYAREPWQDNPYNPQNNINYTAEQGGLATEYPDHPGGNANPFFRAIPQLEGLELVHGIQKAHVRKLMEVSLRYDHVLYTISNETRADREWSDFWARFLRDEAQRAGKDIHITEMWDAWEMDDPMHRATFDHPEPYSFIDISQNSHQRGQAQWDKLQWVRRYVADPPRPVNSVKMYGGKHGGGPEEGQHKLWRNVLGGTASARYHRPGGGMGLNDVTEAHLRSMSMALEKVDIFAMEPANDLLSDRADDGAYLAAAPGRDYLLYFPRGGSVTVDITGHPGHYKLHWLNVLESTWGRASTVEGDSQVQLECPGKAPWAVVITSSDAGR